MHGAAADILVDAHPHIGTNKLPKVVETIRHTILQAGGKFISTHASKILSLSTAR
jgi:uncharacterized FAD-dependent dehydrogenase